MKGWSEGGTAKQAEGTSTSKAVAKLNRLYLSIDSWSLFLLRLIALFGSSKSSSKSFTSPRFPPPYRFSPSLSALPSLPSLPSLSSSITRPTASISRCTCHSCCAVTSDLISPATLCRIRNGNFGSILGNKPKTAIAHKMFEADCWDIPLMLEWPKSLTFPDLCAASPRSTMTWVSSTAKRRTSRVGGSKWAMASIMPEMS
mmetsp:Transcript_6617/g.12920  ORF Transcript_6617/g.12920 Transcript_6617/m.12920 type:complete len:201 (+) Transcript_6617:96-698(+)